MEKVVKETAKKVLLKMTLRMSREMERSVLDLNMLQPCVLFQY